MSLSKGRWCDGTLRRPRAGPTVSKGRVRDPVELLEDGHLRVGDRVGVIIAVDRPSVGLAAVEVEPVHLVLRPLDEIDRLLVERRRGVAEVDLADDRALVRRVDHHEVVG